jgi:hypothetical protein
LEVAKERKAREEMEEDQQRAVLEEIRRVQGDIERERAAR